MTRKRILRFGVAMIGATLASLVHAGRYEQFIIRVRDNPGPPLLTVFSTRIGSAGDEAILGGGVAPDGSVILVGQAIGPQILEFPEVRVTQLTDDQTGQRNQPAPDRPGRLRAEQLIRPDAPLASTFILRLTPDGQHVLAMTRFGFGTTGLLDAAVDPDGSVYLTVRAHADRLERQLGRVRVHQTPVAERKPTGKPDAVLIKLVPQLDAVSWMHTLLGAEGGSGRITLAQDGIWIDVNGMRRISRDGATHQSTDIPGRGRTVDTAVDPRPNGLIVHGGDRNTSTGREPWRSPYLHLYRRDGQRLRTLWNWPSQTVGNDRYRLVSDSSPRVQGFDHEGRIVVAGWSDGGNTVFNRHPTDLDTPHGAFESGLINSAWGMRVGSLTSIMVIDPVSYDVVRGTLWVSFVPDDPETFGRDVNRPNNAAVNQLAVLADGSLALTGTAATGLIETPDAWFRYPGRGRMGGWYVSVLTPDLKNLRFSSYVPGGQSLRVIPAGAGLLVVGAIEPPAPDGPSITLVNPLQPDPAGGRLDGFVALLRPPP